MTKPDRGVARITGASTGIGRATAEALRDAGYRVFGTSRKSVPQRSDGITMLICDVTNDASVANLVDDVLVEAGRIDLLVNNARSGAGFPGVPLAIARPGLRFTLIEPRGKRAAFLLHVVGVLGLSRVTVVDRAIDPRAPGVYAGRFARVLARAVADPMEAIRIARPLLRADGQVAVWVSDKQAAEAPEEFQRVSYRLPGTTIARVLLVASSR